MDKRAQEKAFAQIIAKTWLDQEFKNTFLANPEKVLAENGIQMDQIALPEMSECLTDTNFNNTAVAFAACHTGPKPDIEDPLSEPLLPWEIGA